MCPFVTCTVTIVIRLQWNFLYLITWSVCVCVCFCVRACVHACLWQFLFCLICIRRLNSRQHVICPLVPFNLFLDSVFFSLRETVKHTILEKFAGPPDTGVFSASVQNTLYITGKAVVGRIPQVCLFYVSNPLPAQLCEVHWYLDTEFSVKMSVRHSVCLSVQSSVRKTVHQAICQLVIHSVLCLNECYVKYFCASP